MERCHYCDDADTEWICPRCNEPTCEDCFEEMTQWNAGNPLPCKACQSDREAEYHRERDREHQRDIEKAEKAAKRREAYWTPEAVAKRNESRKKRLAEKAERQRAMNESIEKSMGEFVKTFGWFF